MLALVTGITDQALVRRELTGLLAACFDMDGSPPIPAGRLSGRAGYIGVEPGGCEIPESAVTMEDTICHPKTAHSTENGCLIQRIK